MDSRIAKKIKSKNTKIEISLAKVLSSKGLKYKKHCSFLPGNPDFCFPKQKLAIFCDSEFWHGKKLLEGQDFKTNKSFWEKKILRNIARDAEVNKELSVTGWKILRFWGEEINKNPNLCISKILKALEEENSERLGENLLKKAKRF